MVTDWSDWQCYAFYHERFRYTFRWSHFLFAAMIQPTVTFLQDERDVLKVSSQCSLPFLGKHHSLQADTKMQSSWYFCRKAFHKWKQNEQQVHSSSFHLIFQIFFLRQCTVEVSMTKFEHIHKHMHREHICTQLCTSMGVFFLVCTVPWIQERLDFRVHGSADRTISPTIEGLWGQLWVTSKLWQVGFWGLAMFFFKEGLLFRQWMVAFWVGSKRAVRKRWPGSRLACLVTCLKNGVYLIET